jgi:sugar phosphate isomerase/epimerase
VRGADDLTRRDALALAAGAVVATALPQESSRSAEKPMAAKPSVAKLPRPALTLFSRHLHWTDVEGAIEVAASAGYGGISWTVRDGGHISPQNVARDLRRAVELTHRAGLTTPLVATSLTDADSPHAEAIVETVAGLGIRTYRAQSDHYDLRGALPGQLDVLRPRIAGLVRLNARYGATAVFHTHSGEDTVGGAVWDLWLLLRDFDPDRVAINFDAGHGTMAAGSGWTQAVRFIHGHIRTLSLKDFRWRQQGEGDGRRWVAEICQPGQGMVNFQDVFGYFRSIGFDGPAEVQFEYPVPVPGRSQPISLMTGEVGKWQLEMSRADFVALLKRDGDFFAAQLEKAGLLQS